MAFSLVLIISCIIRYSSGIPLDEFFPYGVEADDLLVNRTLDGSSPPIFVPSPFRFFDAVYSIVYVSKTLIWHY